MDHKERFDQLESLIADMLRRLDQLAANQQSLAAGQQNLAAGQQNLATGQQSLATGQQNLAAGQQNLATGQDRTNSTLDGVINVLKIVDQRFKQVEDYLMAADERQFGFEKSLLKMDERQQRFETALLKIDERQQRFEESQQALLAVVQQQTDHLGAAFRALESHDGRLQKLEGTPPATSMRPVR